MSKSCYFFNKRPLLSIEGAGGKSLGRCFYEGNYKITSLTKLTRDSIKKLWEAGLLGSGQTWGIKSKCDGSEEPAGFDLVEGTMVDSYTGEKLNIPPVNYFGEPVPPSKAHYYEYLTYYQCDSSD